MQVNVASGGGEFCDYLLMWGAGESLDSGTQLTRLTQVTQVTQVTRVTQAVGPDIPVVLVVPVAMESLESLESLGATPVECKLWCFALKLTCVRQK